MPDYNITFDGPNTQNITGPNWNAANVAFIPTYPLHQQVMTEFVGSGIITSITVSQLGLVYLKKGVGAGTPWGLSMIINSFVYTITVCMMGSVSAVFNPAVLFGWAILGRVTWTQWIALIFAQTAGYIAGTLCSYSQLYQYLSRVPIPRKDADGNWIYVEVCPWKWVPGEVPPPARWKRGELAFFRGLKFNLPLFLGGGSWAKEPEYEPEATLDLPESQRKILDQETPAGKSSEEEPGPTDKELAESPEYLKELREDQRRKLMVFAEIPYQRSPFFINQIFPHVMAGTTLCHWLSFTSGNATQLTNNNMYLAQHPSSPGSNFAYLEQVALGFIWGLAYFLLQASAGTTANLQLNPGIDLAGRLLHTLLPIANKGSSRWSYAWVPLLVPFFGAFLGCALMYMGMWSKMYFPFRPYGEMPSWY